MRNLSRRSGRAATTSVLPSDANMYRFNVRAAPSHFREDIEIYGSMHITTASWSSLQCIHFLIPTSPVVKVGEARLVRTYRGTDLFYQHRLLGRTRIASALHFREAVVAFIRLKHVTVIHQLVKNPFHLSGAIMRCTVLLHLEQGSTSIPALRAAAV